MRRFLIDLGTVARDLLRVMAITVLALTVVLVSGMAVHIGAGPEASLYVINEGLVAVALGLLGWLTIVGRHRYERRPR
ncbi:hypothetical protein ACIRG5_42545 [Lentzea sp. NPDC102401]|uniref:hypothetical protein n=1 Tax=Lentzea sp. NPDC102401 TaxID=3364128 RepID=UPI00381696BA